MIILRLIRLNQLSSTAKIESTASFVLSCHLSSSPPLLQSTAVFSTVPFLSVLLLHMHLSNPRTLVSNLCLLSQIGSILSRFGLLEHHLVIYVFCLASQSLCRVSPSGRPRTQIRLTDNNSCSLVLAPEITG